MARRDETSLDKCRRRVTSIFKAGSYAEAQKEESNVKQKDKTHGKHRCDKDRREDESIYKVFVGLVYCR
jgi:hypothetical protein